MGISLIVSRSLFAALLTCGWWGLPGVCSRHAPTVTRQEFAAAMAQVQRGMSKEEILRILGKPDDVRPRMESDPSITADPVVAEAWCYGTGGPGTFPTLGNVEFGEDGKVLWRRGGEGTPPRPSVITEPRLRSALRALDSASALEGVAFDPLAVVRAVNELLPLGKEAALAAITEYARVCPHNAFGQDQGGFLVLRCLFDPPCDAVYVPPVVDLNEVFYGRPGPQRVIQAGRMLPLDLQETGVRLSDEPDAPPRYPILILDDVPLMLVGRCLLLVDPYHANIQEHVEFCRAHCDLRKGPMRPSCDPVAVLEKLKASPYYAFSDGDGMILRQLARLMAPVLGPDVQAASNAGVSEMKEVLSRPRVRWDPDRNTYVRSE
jgi:hypothetical protein